MILVVKLSRYLSPEPVFTQWKHDNISNINNASSHFNTKVTEDRWSNLGWFAQKHIKNTNKIYYFGCAVKILITPKRVQTW